MFSPTLSVFTKPWQRDSLESLADQIAAWGVQGIEFPVRKGFQVEPGNALDRLPEAGAVFRKRGLRIISVATHFDGSMIRSCAAAGVSILRIMLPVDPSLGYRASVDRFQRTADSLTPLLRETGVVVGVQNHAGNFVGSAVGLMEAMAPLDPACFQAVLDLGHTALAGEPEPIALDLAAPRLAMVNLKNAVRRETGRDRTGASTWAVQWTDARSGYTSWPTVVRELRRRRFEGPICLTAEYKDERGDPLTGQDVNPLIRADLDYIKSLWLEPEKEILQ
ncbi:MAG: sugar phosphate isomerase/epimerase [Opitutaceae bacterium]